jgi:hypothetical protein
MGLVISILLLIFLANMFTDYHYLHQYAMASLCGLGILAVVWAPLLFCTVFVLGMQGVLK